MLSYLFTNPLLFAVYIVSLLVAIAVHEFSHAFTADYLGDPTPRLQNRLKLDPRAHIDPMGIFFLLVFGFGWGKPVEFDPYNLKNPRRDAALISLAGPTSNFILAILLSITLRLLILFKLNILVTMGMFIVLPMMQMNLVLGVFNLLPIHPLDGFSIVGGILPKEKAHEWYGLQRFGMLFLLLLIIPLGGSSMLDGILRPAVTFLFKLLVPFNLGGGVI